MPTHSLMILTAGLAVCLPVAGAEPLRFNRDVLPILSDRCFHCHGPDGARRKAGLRLDRETDARRVRDGTAAVVPGKPEASELVRRITTDDPDEQMPPKGSGRELSRAEAQVLRRWVAEGAKWEAHWAFIPPTRPEPPVVKAEDRVKSPIDRFILARLEEAGLTLSGPADRTTLIRRMSIDLTGLPPTPEEVDAFVGDSSPDAVGRLADRLLASPRFGERMAWRWLEAARYADTNGYQTDAERDMWRWRDWVIEAYNRNLPFDQFTIEQLAGDLLPGATLDQKIATGFNRNHRGNAEGGIVPEEYAVEYVADRVETTATVWLGLTLGCARCHDHKYDPFTQSEFYKLFAFFNNVPEKGRAVKFGNSPPYLKAPTRDQQAVLARLEQRVAEAEQRFRELQAALAEAQARWERSVKPGDIPDWSPERRLVARLDMRPADKLNVREGPAVFAPGRVGRALDLDGTRYVEAGDVGNFGFDDRFTLSLWVNPRKASGALIARMAEEPRADGYSVHLVNGKVQVHLTKRWLDDALRVETLRTVVPGRWQHVTVTYDGSRLASGVSVYLDGEEVKTTTLLDELNQSFATKEPLRIGTGGGKGSRLDGLVSDVRIYDRALNADEVRALAVPATSGQILDRPAVGRTAAEAAKLRAYYLAKAAPDHIRDAYDALHAARAERDAFLESIPTVMVMEEMPTPRPTHVLIRGEYDRPGARVKPGLPDALPPSPRAVHRLDLANWLVSPHHPLTARVAVNRIWQLHFGTGLVRTGEDFGTQGEYPSHPELLDWLAVEFVRSGWDLKHVHRLIVTSAVYGQSSVVAPGPAAQSHAPVRDPRLVDPDNRLLARFPRYRLSAEMIRDQALFAAGLLVERHGGPSVKPYQPAGLWNELSGAGDYVPDTGDRLYRRGLYTFWKRTVPPPGLSAFDATARETCWVRETRTNTPLQALTLLNDVTYVESARKLAERVLREAAGTDDRLALAFRRLTSRSPTDAERSVLRRSLEGHLAEYQQAPAVAQKVLQAGESLPDPKLDPVAVAAYAAVCRLILNLDESVTKE